MSKKIFKVLNFSYYIAKVNMLFAREQTKSFYKSFMISKNKITLNIRRT